MIQLPRSLAAGSVENIIHKATINGKKQGDNFIILFHTASAERSGTCFFCTNRFFPEIYYQKLLFIVLGTLLLIQIIIFIFWRYFKSQKSEMTRFETSEKMLFKLIEEMPVGVIIHNKNREIIKLIKLLQISIHMLMKQK